MAAFEVIIYGRFWAIAEDLAEVGISDKWRSRPALRRFPWGTY